MWPHTECYTLEKFSCSVRLRFLVAVFLPKTSMSHQFAVCVIFIIMDSHSNKFRIYELVRENDLIIVALDYFPMLLGFFLLILVYNFCVPLPCASQIFESSTLHPFFLKVSHSTIAAIILTYTDMSIILTFAERPIALHVTI